MGNRDREEPSDPREFDDRRRHSSSNKRERPIGESKTRREYDAEGQLDRDRQREDKHRRRRAEVQVVSSPESEPKAAPEEGEPIQEADEPKQSSSSSSDSSDEGNYFIFF